MQCKICGMENAADAKFCKRCGNKLGADISVETPAFAPVVVPVAAPVAAPDKEEKKAKKPLPAWFLIVGAVVLVAAIVVACLFIFADTKIDLGKYLTLKDNGYDGYGTVEWEINWKKLKRDYGDELKEALNKESDGYVKKTDPHEMLEMYVSIDIKNNKALKNGDSISYTWKLDELMEDLFDGIVFVCEDGSHTVEDLEEPDTFDAFADFELYFTGYSTMGTASGYCYGLLYSDDYVISKTHDLANGDVITVTLRESVLDYCMEYYNEVPETLTKEYIVSGLPELIYFDPFESLTVSFSGFEPFGSLSLSYNGHYLSYYDFDVPQWENLSNGDTFTISLPNYVVENCLSLYGAVPTAKEKTYTVSGLSAYVTSLSQVDLDAMKSQAADVLASERAWWDDEVQMNSLDYMGSYLMIRKNLSSYSTNNKIYLLYKMNVTATEGSYTETKDIYWYICFYNLTLDGENKLYVDLFSYDTAYDSVKLDPNTSNWNYWDVNGYESLDSFYTKNIQADLANWTYETNVGAFPKVQLAA